MADEYGPSYLELKRKVISMIKAKLLDWGNNLHVDGVDYVLEVQSQGNQWVQYRLKRKDNQGHAPRYFEVRIQEHY